MLKRSRIPPSCPGAPGGLRHGNRRRGFSLVELLVAFVLFGVALAGLCPLVIMQSRQLQRLESRFSPNNPYYLAPSRDQWARKLGAAATAWPQDPGFAESPGPPNPVNVVQILSLDQTPTGMTMTAHVSVTGISP